MLLIWYVRGYEFNNKLWFIYLFTGVNKDGQTYFVYNDGSYSYINRDSLKRLSSIYHREKDGSVSFDRLPDVCRQSYSSSSSSDAEDEEFE